MNRSLSLAARRTTQTLTEFANGPRILWDLASQRTPWGRGELEFRLEGGGVVHCPNQPGARVPVYELFAEDAYRLDTLFTGLDNPTVLDIGGHIGCFSVAVARHAPGARIGAYEASPSTASWLVRNVAANDLEDRVTVHQVAISDHQGSLEFADNGSGSSLNGLTAPDGSARIVQVPCITIGDAFAAAPAPVDVVKIDTEGAEYAMILSSQPSMWSSVLKVVIEYHDVAGHDWAELRAFFEAAGLEVTHLEEVSPRQGTAWLTRER